MKGISLVEILICLLIISCVIVVSPMVGSFIQHKTIERVEADLRGIVHFAKSQSLFSGKILQLSPLSPKQGWAYGIGLYEVGDTQRLLQQWLGYAGNVKITWSGFQAKDYVQFSSKLRESTANGYFTITVQDVSRILVINRLGRIK